MTYEELLNNLSTINEVKGMGLGDDKLDGLLEEAYSMLIEIEGSFRDAVKDGWETKALVERFIMLKAEILSYTNSLWDKKRKMLGI